MRRSMELIRLGYLAGGAPFYAISSVLFGRHPWIRRDYVEFFLIVAGEGHINTLLDDGTISSVPFVPGEVMFFRPRDTYQTVGTGESGMSCYVVAMPVSRWEDFATFVGLSPSWLTAPEPPHVVCDTPDPRVRDAFRRAVDGYRRGPTTFDVAEFLVAIWPTLAGASHLGPARPEPPAWLRDAVEAMRSEGNLREGFPRFLELARVSPAHLSRVVREFHGVTPSQLVLEMRLHHAGILLGTTSHSIGSIAQRCGFANVSHFSKVFRRASLVTPREYRRDRLGGYVIASVDGSRVLPPSTPPRVERAGELPRGSWTKDFLLDDETVVIFGS